jgi:hypothetical protein
MHRTIWRPVIALGLLVTLGGCTSASVGNLIAGATGGKAQVRLIDAAPQAPGPLSLVVANTAINTGLTASTPVGTYAYVGAGIQSLQVSPTNVPAVSKSVAASTFYTVALAGEPGTPDYAEYIFQDTNALPAPNTVRFKVNDAAPAAGPIDVYVYTGSVRPSSPTVAGLTPGNDSGSLPTPPGNAYIPPEGSMTSLPAGTYTVTVTPAGAPATTLFTGSLNLTVNTSYSFTVEDAANGGSSSVQVIAAIDQPVQVSNQANLLTVARLP